MACTASSFRVQCVSHDIDSLMVAMVANQTIKLRVFKCRTKLGSYVNCTLCALTLTNKQTKCCIFDGFTVVDNYLVTANGIIAVIYTSEVIVHPVKMDFLLIFWFLICMRHEPCFASPTDAEIIQGNSGPVLKLGDNCTNDDECNTAVISGLVICNMTTNVCSCHPNYPISLRGKNGCVHPTSYGASCNYTEECNYKFSSCYKKVCDCSFLYRYDYNQTICVYKYSSKPDGIDFTMLGVLVGLILMFIIMCVVLQMFSRAQFRNQRTIFNSPHPRLLRIKLGKHSTPSKRRSRQPSIASQNSPRLSRQGSSRSGSRRASRESLRCVNDIGKTNPVMTDQRKETQ